MLSEFHQGSKVVAMSTGFLDRYQSMIQIRKQVILFFLISLIPSLTPLHHQVIVVLFADWTVLCFNDYLNLLWQTKLSNSTHIARCPYCYTVVCACSCMIVLFSEAVILVTPFNVRNVGDRGSVVVGGRASSDVETQDSYSR